MDRFPAVRQRLFVDGETKGITVEVKNERLVDVYWYNMGEVTDPLELPQYFRAPKKEEKDVKEEAVCPATGVQDVKEELKYLQVSGTQEVKKETLALITESQELLRVQKPDLQAAEDFKQRLLVHYTGGPLPWISPGGLPIVSGEHKVKEEMDVNRRYSEDSRGGCRLDGPSYNTGVAEPCNATNVVRRRNFPAKSFARVPCPHCPEISVSPSLAERHEKLHRAGPQFLCHMCGRAYQKRRTLNAHIRTHDGQRRYLCQMCGRTYARRSGLRAHLATHSPADTRT